MENKNQWKPDCVCPVCGQYKFDGIGDICNVCFWENDDVQYENPDFDWEASGGPNRSSLNEYKKWWDKLEKIMPRLIDKYCISISKHSLWKYEKLKVGRKYKKDIIEEIKRNNIDFEKNWIWISLLTPNRTKSQNQI